MAPSAFETRVRADVKEYAQELLRCVEANLFTDQSREAAIGALAYLVEEADLVADDVPNLGLLDDALALVTAAQLLGEVHDLGPRLNRERVRDDVQTYQKHAQMMMQNFGAVSLGGLAAQGRRVDDYEDFVATVRKRLESL